MIGTTLSHYRITEKLGAGGMGVVYRAEDTNLNRQVAIKVLPEMFSGDPERMARFEREAKLLASLNHPNIAAIYGLEEAGGKRFLVLELVEGETLAQRIAKGCLPLDEALDVCRQIAEGLEAAHEKGVIHRDLKPANVKITPEGKIKVLDFGLAKAFHGEMTAADASHSPTLTDQMTRPGVILGTAAYMAPEQAKGKAVDKRADIWAFGCILFECLTSKRAFAGETVTETLAAILKGEPDWSELPAFTALKAKDLLRRCLEKDPRRRLHDVADARIEIDDALSTRVTGAAAELQDKQHRAPRLRLLALGLTVGAAITSGMVIGALLWNYVRWTRPAPQLPMRFVLPLPPSSDIEVGVAQAVLAISPDGSQLVYVARSEGTTQLFLRRIGQLDILPIAGTEGATGPFFSPEGAWVGFFAGGSLKKVSLAGGSLVTICESAGRGPHSGIWTADGTIIFAPEYNTGLSRISSDGGRLQPVTIPNPTLRETSHGWPQILPGGQTILYTVKPGNIASYDDAQIVVKRLGTTAPKILIRGATYARYVPTGHLVYARAGKLFAVPFDLNNLSVTGSPMPILEGLITVPSYGSAQYAFSDTGLLAYVPGGALPPKDRFLLWVDSHGGQQAIMSRRNNYAELRFSPDGLRLAVRIAAANDDVWLYEPARDTLTRLTDEDGDEVSPVWTPKGDRVAYSSEAGGAANLFWKASDGSGLPEPLLINEHTKYPGSFSPNGEFLAFVDVDPTNGRDIWLLSIQGERKAKPFRRTQFDEWEPKFSPDGRWLAYASNRTGRDEIYIEPFPGPGGQQQISTNGGDHPVWVHNGQELFYRNGNKMMAVSIDAQSGKPGTGRMLFEGNYFQSRLFACYDVARDGRFLMVSSPQPGAALTQINVVVNWFEELKRLVPTGK